MQSSTVIVRVVDPSIRCRKLNKLVGDIQLSSFIDIISAADLEANARAAKSGDVTDAIEESLETEADIFEFLTKGVLVAARKVEELERNRYRLTFEDPALEGILDGGHNTLAVGKWVLRKVLTTVLEDPEKASTVVDKIKRWDDFQEAWSKYREQVDARKGEFKDILIPIEIVYPTDDAEGQAEFQDRILKINAARNNNAELTEETKANKRGHYDEIRNNLDEVLRDQVEWKTNDGGRIKVRELVSLALIPISKLDGTKYPPAAKVASSPNIIFSSKGQCVSLFNDLLEVDGVTTKVKGDIIKVEDESVGSALALMKDLPALFDLVYELLPAAYNKASPGFGRINGVKNFDPEKAKAGKEGYVRTRPKTRFYQREVDYGYGEGFIYPVVYGLSALLEVKDGKLVWLVPDPKAFLAKHLPTLMKSYYSMISGMSYDPAKVGKSNGAYNLAYEMFKGSYRDELLAKVGYAAA